jgi:hypothetical protein
MMIVHRDDDLPAALVVARPDGGRRLVVIVGGDLDRTQVRELSRLLLAEPERRQLLRGIC